MIGIRRVGCNPGVEVFILKVNHGPADVHCVGYVLYDPLINIILPVGLMLYLIYVDVPLQIKMVLL